MYATSICDGEHPLPRTTNQAILQHALWMQREDYKNSTIKSAIKTLKAVGKESLQHH